VEIPLYQEKLQVVAAYKPPLISWDFNNLAPIFARVVPTILGGDLNSKHPAWGSRTTNAAGGELLRWIQAEGADFSSPFAPTHYNPPDVLDICLIKNLPWVVRSQVLQELSSDHNPVIVTIERVDLCVAQRALTKVNWNSFKTHLEQQRLEILPLKTPREVEFAAETMTSYIQSALKASTTTIAADFGLYFPRALQELKHTRNRLRRLAQRTEDPAAKREHRHAQNAYARALDKHFNDEWEDWMSSLDIQDNTIWKAVNTLAGRRSRITNLQTGGVMISDDAEMAETFADSLADQFRPNLPSPTSPVGAEVEETIADYIESMEQPALDLTSPKEVAHVIKYLKNRKAPGKDGIKNTVLKNLPKKTVAALTGIINACLTLCFFPSAWKEAIVVPILKPGLPSTDPASYRPISLLPTLGKLLEVIILRRLKMNADVENLLRDEQHGFRTGLSTTMQLAVVTEKITQGFNNHQATGGLFFDISKAFDKVWHLGILAKMVTMQLPADIVKMVRNYLSDRQFRVRVNTALGTPRDILSGVPQGSVLGPLLFNLFINDIPSTDNCSIHLYADDTAILSTSSHTKMLIKRLQEAADSITEWCDKWRVKMNPAKTVAVVFRPSRKRRYQPESHVNFMGQQLPWSSSVKYLGMILDIRLTYKEHISKRLILTAAARKKLNPLIWSKKLSLRCKKLLYTSILRPMITYACPIWLTATKSQIERVEVFQNKVLRSVTRAPQFVRNSIIRQDLNLETIQDHVSRLAKRFYHDPERTGNRPLAEALDYQDTVFMDFKARPRQVLRLLACSSDEEP
jgi:hypothetical protein